MMIPKGLNKEIVLQISRQKNEPSWMTRFRLHALDLFERMPMPDWGADLSQLDIQDLRCYIKAAEKQWSSWDSVPAAIKDRFEQLGIPQAEQQFLAGVGAQYESEMIYKNLKDEWAHQGVVFCDTSTGLQEYPDLFKKYFASVIAPHDNKFAALNSALWSGGSFIIIPAGVHVDMPLQTYFRINSPSMGQFERTLIIAQPGSKVHYVEGCSAPQYQQGSLHAGVVEIVALAGSHVRYTTIQNWSSDVYNLVTKRAIAHSGATVQWVDGNFGSAVTMKYPCVVLQGARSKGEIVSIAVAGKGQQQDAGGKMIHVGPETTSHVISKSVCKEGGRSTYRGLVKVGQKAFGARAKVQCDSLLLDDISRVDAQPKIISAQPDADVGHEASVSNIDERQLFYLQSRGINKSKARSLIVNGFIDAFVKELPMEYAVEINRMIELELS